MKVIILLSGQGQRFIDAGYMQPKPLIPIDGKPMIHHVVDMFPIDYSDFIFVCNDIHMNNSSIGMESTLRDKAPNSTIFTIKSHKLGPVYSLQQVSEYIPEDEEIIVSYCDYGTVWNFDKFLTYMRSTGAEGGIAAYIGFHPHMLGKDHYAYMLHDRDMNVTRIQEKRPFGQNKMEEYASNGCYFFKTGRLLRYYISKMLQAGDTHKVNREYYASMLYNIMIDDGLIVKVHEIDKMLQWGTPFDLQNYLMWSEYFSDRITKPLVRNSKLTNTTIILPMAGRGSRFALKGYDDPKPFLQVDGKAMYLQALDCLPVGSTVHIITLKEHRKWFDKFPPPSHIKVHEIDEVTDGQATTCMTVIADMEKQCDDPIMITACDNGAYYDEITHEELVNDPDIDVIVWAFDNHPSSKLYPHMYAWLDVDDAGYIKRVSIKRPFDDIENRYAIIGTMYFRKASIFKEGYDFITEHNLRTNGEYYVDNVLEPLINIGYRVKMFCVKYYLCWGTPEDYRTYNYWYDHFCTRVFSERKQCIFCNATDLDEMFSNDKTVPLGSYTTSCATHPCKFMPFNIQICSKCATHQIKYLGDISEVYDTNHAYSFGEILKRKILEFSNCINDTICMTNIEGIIEIGAGSGKLADHILTTYNGPYYIVDPHYFGQLDNRRIVIPQYAENLDPNSTPLANTVIMSHVFEHFYEPLKILEKLQQSHSHIKYVCLDFPDLETYVKKGTYHVLNPEHTFYVDNNFLSQVFQRHGFQLLKKQHFADHSVFLIFERVTHDTICTLPAINESAKNSIAKFVQEIATKVNRLNKLLENTDDIPKYIWPCSMHTQYLFVYGLRHDLLTAVLDNSPAKIGNFMYGYRKPCASFQGVIDSGKPALVIMNGGCFNQEVIEAAKQKNPHITFLE